MTRDVQLPEPAAELLAVASRVTPVWLRSSVVAVASRGGVDLGDDAEVGVELDRLVADETGRLLAALGRLLATDVDQQRTNPLSLFRDAVRGPTSFLQRCGVAPPPPDSFAAQAFPDDVYRLGPATWSDVDPELHVPGLTWGAWKAMTVLRRRRDEGLR